MKSLKQGVSPPDRTSVLMPQLPRDDTTLQQHAAKITERHKKKRHKRKALQCNCHGERTQPQNSGSPRSDRKIPRFPDAIFDQEGIADIPERTRLVVESINPLGKGVAEPFPGSLAVAQKQIKAVQQAKLALKPAWFFNEKDETPECASLLIVIGICQLPLQS